MRFLVDTNVFLDILLEREESYEDSLRFFQWCKQNKNEIYITSMSFRDIEYTVRKIVLDREKTRDILLNAYSICSKIIGISADDAINSIFGYSTDFEDELIMQAAEEAMVDSIITNNTKDFKHSKIPVFNPVDFLKLANA